MKCINSSPSLECGSKPPRAWDLGTCTGATGDVPASAQQRGHAFLPECHLRWERIAWPAGPCLCSAHGGPVGIVSFMTGAHLSKTVRQSWTEQGSREGAGAQLSVSAHTHSEGVLGAARWSCFLRGDRTMPLSLLPRCCCHLIGR